MIREIVALFLELLRKFPSREVSSVNQGNVPLVIGLQIINYVKGIAKPNILRLHIYEQTQYSIDFEENPIPQNYHNPTVKLLPVFARCRSELLQAGRGGRTPALEKRYGGDRLQQHVQRCYRYGILTVNYCRNPDGKLSLVFLHKTVADTFIESC